MTLGRVFRHPMIWGMLVVTVIMGMLMTLGYLGAFLSPEDHTHDAPFVLVNEDQGVEISGQTTNFGEQVVAAITSSDAFGDKVEWHVLDSRDAALETLGDNEAYAAIVIPALYSQQIAAISQAATTGTATPATIDVIMNSGAGAYTRNLATTVTTGTIATISDSVETQLVTALGGDTAQVPVALADILTDPVVANTSDVAPTGGHTAGGNAAFYYALLLMLGGFVGMDVIFLGLEMFMGRSVATRIVARVRGEAVPLTSFQSWATRVGVSALLAIVGGAAQAWVAIGWLNMAVDETWPLVFFGMLAIFTSAMFTLLFLTLLGTPGLLLAILVQTFLGAPSARGIFPKEMLPTFYQWMGDILPLRYITDGVRAIMFYGADADAGVTRGIVGLAIIAAVSFVVSGLYAWVTSRREGVATPEVVLA